MTSQRPGDDDLDARFRSIMDEEFGRSPAPDPEPFNMMKAMDEVEPDAPDDPFVAPQPLPRPISTPGFLVSSLLLSFSTLVMLGAVFGAPVHNLTGWAVVTFVLGMVVAWRSLPKQPQDLDDDGAQV
ncbi:hypothetical protein ACTQ49_04130 [Luteococcus sp. Sow4_B9]|uniref:hypothetical protein n=1 Tax=Luteococcus sp. Sow4_B9 TaxID=3438792 RepID=UPI003F97CFA2